MDSEGEMGSDIRLLISLTCLIVLAILAVVVAKLVDRCHDRVSLRDDVSDISEHTRQILKARLVVKGFMRSKVKAEEAGDKAATIARAWRVKALRGPLDPDEDIKNPELKITETTKSKISMMDMNFQIKDENKPPTDQNKVAFGKLFDRVKSEQLEKTVEDNAVGENESKEERVNNNNNNNTNVDSNGTNVNTNIDSKSVKLTTETFVITKQNAETLPDNDDSGVKTDGNITTVESTSNCVPKSASKPTEPGTKTTNSHSHSDTARVQSLPHDLSNTPENSNTLPSNRSNTPDKSKSLPTELVRDSTDPQPVAVISRQKLSRTPSSSSRIMSFFKRTSSESMTVPKPKEHNGASSLTAVEVAVIDLHDSS